VNRYAPTKPQRIRDPLHNLVEFEFRSDDQIEHAVWAALQTRPFQRLRRIRQLGFSELVYPGATHTRFAHSLGVFHTARQLMGAIERHVRSHGGRYLHHQANVALAAALVHDVGHGMFSHAFEEVGKTLDLKMAHHEHVSEALIRDSEIKEAFEKELGPHFASEVADVISRGRPGNLYDAVVSSQFDADRLDYMRRDRLMTGAQGSGIDFDWLIANLEIGSVAYGVDEQEMPPIETFVLGPKAFHAAEAYVLALFQLYPTVYLHKTTRAAEKLFSAMMIRLITLVRGEDWAKTGLPEKHPIIRFALEPDSLARAQALDDTVFWGALPMLAEADDPLICDGALRMRDRRLPKCVDIRSKIAPPVPANRARSAEERSEEKKRADRLKERITIRLTEWAAKNSPAVPRILVDSAGRTPYKPFKQTTGPLNQILIRTVDGTIRDMAECSPVVSGIETFEVFRAYVDENDADAKLLIDTVIEEEIGRENHVRQA
jgi:uncharacterized protein